MGDVGRYRSVDRRRFDSGTRVLCRTGRGLEIGETVCAIEIDEAKPTDSADGELLRRLGPEDELIAERLDRHRDRAFLACEELLRERSLPGTLIDVEQLFDGESLYFYFLGPVEPQTQAMIAELAETYDRKVGFRTFAKALAEGCGPDCGTGVSCGTGGNCGSCKLSAACGR